MLEELWTQVTWSCFLLHIAVFFAHPFVLFKYSKLQNYVWLLVCDHILSECVCTGECVYVYVLLDSESMHV